MRVSLILIFLAGCSKSPETLTNPTSAGADEEPMPFEFEEAVSVEGLETVHELWSPSPRLTDRGAAIYDIAPLMEVAGSQEGSLVLNVAADFKSVELLLFPPDAYFEMWRTDLPLITGATSYLFVITTPFHNDLMGARRMRDASTEPAPWPTWLDLRDLPVSEECAGHNLNFVLVQFLAYANVQGGTVCVDEGEALEEDELGDLWHVDLPSGAVTLFFTP